MSDPDLSAGGSPVPSGRKRKCQRPVQSRPRKNIRENSKAKSDSDDTSTDSRKSTISLTEAEVDKESLETLNRMSELMQRFTLMREKLYATRKNRVEIKLRSLKRKYEANFLAKSRLLQEQCNLTLQVNERERELQIKQTKVKFEAEEQMCRQTYENEKRMIHDSIKDELDRRRLRLEEDIQNIDITSDLWQEEQTLRNGLNLPSASALGLSSGFGPQLAIGGGGGGLAGPGSRRQGAYHDPSLPHRRKKPVSVNGPYIVYQLHESDIVDDWSEIMKALKKQQLNFNRKHGLSSSSATPNTNLAALKNINAGGFSNNAPNPASCTQKSSHSLPASGKLSDHQRRHHRSGSGAKRQLDTSSLAPQYNSAGSGPAAQTATLQNHNSSEDCNALPAASSVTASRTGSTGFTETSHSRGIIV